MAGVLVDVLLQRLATLALDKIERELNLVVGVKQEIKKLTKKLEAIRAVLEDAEQRQVPEASVKLWLDELNDVAFDMDDVLDEWITRVLKHQLEKEERQGANNALVTTKKKVCFPFPSSCFRPGQVNQLFLRHEIAKKIEELNERLALIDQNKQSFGFQNIPRPVLQLLPQRPITTSLPNPKTFGRDDEVKLIISKLLSESSERSEIPLIIPIVGMGGMGKTTLANLVYNDERIKSHFGDMRMWACVSDPFDEIKIAGAIVESLKKNNTSKELETLTKIINDSIVGKKFLLVLDDVWSPKSHQWEELIKPLRNGAVGSRVLVTTRNQEVTTLMKATTQMIILRGLSEPFCLSLFYYNADVDESSVAKEFHNIGLEIVKRCNGLPLAAKTLGSLMRGRKKIHEWEVVLKSRTWDLIEIQEDVFRPLLLSYHDLDPAVRSCLLYCVMFPKSYKFNRNTLIELWMSQDHLKAKESKEKIAVGQKYFDNLVRRSFFQDIKVFNSGNVECKIHDIVHDFLLYLSKTEYLILKDDEIKEKSNDKVRHLTVVDTTVMDIHLLNCSRLRTLKIINSLTNFTTPILELIIQLKCLRTLILRPPPLGNGFEKIPETIGGLIHLRYLDLSGNKELQELPSALSSLYNLQTLRLVNCRRLTRVDVGRLLNLRHLYVDGCYRLKLIVGVEKLTNMQTLDRIRVETSDGEGNKLEVLKDLNQLQGSLTIEIFGNNPNIAENAAILVNKPHLLQLTLQFEWGHQGGDREIMDALEGLKFAWGHQGDDSEIMDGSEGLEFEWDHQGVDSEIMEGSEPHPGLDFEWGHQGDDTEIMNGLEPPPGLDFEWGHQGDDTEIMNGLEPHPGLESLSITRYGGGAFSHWLSSLHSLRYLTLHVCPKCITLPPLGKLSSLESLHIGSFGDVEKVGVEFLGIEQGGQTSSSSSSSIFISFPNLKQLDIGYMESWQEWEGVGEENSQNITIMPCLDQLEITHCQKLKALPDFLWKTPLQRLYIWASPTLQNLYREGTSELGLRISHSFYNPGKFFSDANTSSCCIL